MNWLLVYDLNIGKLIWYIEVKLVMFEEYNIDDGEFVEEGGFGFMVVLIFYGCLLLVLVMDGGVIWIYVLDVDK